MEIWVPEIEMNFERRIVQMKSEIRVVQVKINIG